MPPKNSDKTITLKIESEVLNKVTELCKKIEDKLEIVQEGELQNKLKQKLLFCKKYVELLDECLDSCIEIIDGVDNGLNWAEERELKDLLQKRVEG